MYLGWSKLRLENKQLRQTLEQQREAVKFLTETQEKTSNILKELSDTQHSIAQNSKISLGKLYKLEKGSEQIKDYLSVTIPHDIRGLLNSARTGDNNSTTSKDTINQMSRPE